MNGIFVKYVGFSTFDGDSTLGWIYGKLLLGCGGGKFLEVFPLTKRKLQVQ